MQVQAIYRDGRVELLQTLHLKSNNVRVTVNPHVKHFGENHVYR